MKNAFSLVELSIVLVILGLLTGGILAGQNLIRAAELRSVSTQINQIDTAVYTFRDKYFALPGDMHNATDFWGIAAGSAGDDATCIAASATTEATCNGNGDGEIADMVTSSELHEAFHAWKHLANAGLIEGAFTGKAGSGGGRQSVIGVNVPRTKFGEGGISITRHPIFTTHANRHIGESGANIYTIGTASTSYETDFPLLTPEEMWNIDTKMDDGKPATGTILAFKGAGTAQPNCANAADTDYNLTDTAVRCAIKVVTGY